MIELVFFTSSRIKLEHARHLCRNYAVQLTGFRESGWVVAHPKDSNIVFGGNYGGLLERMDHRTGQSRDLNVYPDNPMGWGAVGM